jgi:cation diffusion facilitator family transporter
MHLHTLDSWQHSHDFSVPLPQAEQRTQLVMLLTALTMVAEVIAGTLFGSMALLADGWHMATHVAAFGITLFAYRYARRQANNPKYTFGTGKVSVLAGFASAVVLGVIALLMAIESVVRLFQTQTIHFNEAMGVAVVGLGVNILSAVLLHNSDHSHGHDAHQHDATHHHSGSEHHADHHADHAASDSHAAATRAVSIHAGSSDYNLRAAYLHVIADALTSVLAIAALLGGKLWGWVWLDAVMGMVGAAVISRWAYGLAQETANTLLDGSVETPLRHAIVAAIETPGDDRITDLHVWKVGQEHCAATIALVTHHPQPPGHYKQLLRSLPHLSHVIIEVNRCCQEDLVQ